MGDVTVLSDVSYGTHVLFLKEDEKVTTPSGNVSILTTQLFTRLPFTLMVTKVGQHYKPEPYV